MSKRKHRTVEAVQQSVAVWVWLTRSLVSLLNLRACPFPCSDRLPLAFSPSVSYPTFKFWLKICAIKESVVNEHYPLAGSTPHHFNLYVLWKQLSIALVKSDRLDSDTQPSNTNYITLGKLHIKTTLGIFFIGSHVLNLMYPTFLAWLSCSWHWKHRNEVDVGLALSPEWGEPLA